MDENQNKTIEEKKVTENLDATQASPEPVAQDATNEPVKDLATTPVPTEDEVKDAGLNVAPSDTTMTIDSVDTTISAEPVGNPEGIPTASAEANEDLGVTNMPARTFTQSQVDDIAGKTRTETRDKTFRYIYERYGVNSEAELDDLVGNAQRYDSLKEQFDGEKASWKETSAARDKELMDLSEKVALMQSGIDDARYEDAKFILRGKGMDVTLENINNELSTHPEWRKKVGNEPEQPFVKTGEPMQPAQNEPVSKISVPVLGNERTSNNEMQSEEDMALNRYFKV